MLPSRVYQSRRLGRYENEQVPASLPLKTQSEEFFAESGTSQSAAHPDLESPLTRRIQNTALVMNSVPHVCIAQHSQRYMLSHAMTQQTDRHYTA